jgi:hypothetical protein
VSEAPKNVVIFRMGDTLLSFVDDYQFSNRIRTRADAIRQLIEAGVEAKKIGQSPSR